MISFHNALNKIYSEMSVSALKDKCLIKYPYEVAVFDDFLDPDVFKKIHKDQSIHNFEFEYIPRDQINIADLTYLPLLNITLNGDFFKFLEPIFEKKFERRTDQFPQIREFLDSGSQGMGIHNDEQFIGSTVVFLYLNDWQNGDGGEIAIYNDKMQSTHKIEPKQNRLLVMPITSNSYHSVEPIRPGYKRRCAYFPLNHINFSRTKNET